MNSTEIADFLNLEHHGGCVNVSTFASLSNMKENSVIFVKKFNSNNIGIIENGKNVFVIAAEEYAGRLSVSYVISSNPRLDYLRVIKKYFSPQEDMPGIHPTTVIEQGAKIDATACVGAHCYIGPQVTIGERTIIKPNTTIYGNVTIGSDCYIKAGVSIGGEGFGFERDENGVPVHFPHVGNVIIGNNVYIGANTTIARATLDSTIIEDNVKIDDLVLISHNCHIHKNTIITGGIGFGGGTEIGANCWISGKTIQKIKIGENSMVCSGSVVFRDVKPGTKVFGCPASIMKL